MLGPDEDLDILIESKDHVNILRHLRSKKVRNPDLTLYHGKALLGGDKLDKKAGFLFGDDESTRLAVLEQICLSALDVQDHTLANTCLSQLRASIGNESIRFRMLLARCLEAGGESEKATTIYDEVLKTHPANLLALKRKYCLAERTKDRMESLNLYLEQNASDAAGWYEMSKLRKDMGDFAGAAYALEEVVLVCPVDAPAHVALAEAYSTNGDLLLARRHMAQALELDPNNKRALFGLIMVSNDYLENSSSKSNKNKKQQQNNNNADNEHEIEVAKELIKYSANALLTAYKGNKMFATVQNVVNKYKEKL